MEGRGTPDLLLGCGAFETFVIIHGRSLAVFGLPHHRRITRAVLPPVPLPGYGAAVGLVLLVRHGQTEWSAMGRHTGRSDIPLTEHGQGQATALAAALKAHRFALVLTSPARRAADTCRLAGYGDVAETCDDLWEWDYGAYEGRRTAEIRADRPGWVLWNDGCPDGETAVDVGARVDRVISRCREVLSAAEAGGDDVASGGDSGDGDGGGDVLLVAHGHLLRVLAARWLGLAPDAGRMLALDPATVSVLGTEHEWPVLRSWNAAPPDQG
jgi:probable phosphoglycerate mutase